MLIGGITLCLGLVEFKTAERLVHECPMAGCFFEPVKNLLVLIE